MTIVNVDLLFIIIIVKLSVNLFQEWNLFDKIHSSKKSRQNLSEKLNLIQINKLKSSAFILQKEHRIKQFII